MPLLPYFFAQIPLFVVVDIRWRMAEGIYKFSVHNTLGYYRDHFGRIVIEPYAVLLR